MVSLKADIVEISKTGGDCELQIKNATRTLVGGFLKNIGDGLTEFSVIDEIAANNGLFFDGSFVGLGQPVGEMYDPAILLVNREIPMNGKYIDWKNGYFKFHPSASAPPILDIYAPANTPGIQTILRVTTASATNTPAWELFIDNNSGGGPPDDNIAVFGWNADRRSDITKASWTRRMEYRYTGAFYEDHLEWSNAAITRVYRLQSSTFVDNGTLSTDTHLNFSQATLWEIRTLRNNLAYISASNNSSDVTHFTVTNAGATAGLDIKADPAGSVTIANYPIAGTPIPLGFSGWTEVDFSSATTVKADGLKSNSLIPYSGANIQYGIGGSVVTDYITGGFFQESINSGTGVWKDTWSGGGGFSRQFIAGSTVILYVDKDDVITGKRFSTPDPGAGSGKWLLGKLVTAAVTVDTTRYIQISVDGVLYKLIVST